MSNNDSREEKLRNANLKVKNYKSFGDEAFGYERILSVNLIIGKNNTGKSTLLDLINFAVKPEDLPTLGHQGRAPQLIFENQLTQKLTMETFPSGRQSTLVRQIWSGDDGSFGQLWVGKRVVWELGTDNRRKLIDFDYPEQYKQYESSPQYQSTAENLRELAQWLVDACENPFAGRSFRRVLSDRDIVPEIEGEELGVNPNGSGFTRTVERYLHDIGLDESLIEERIRGELNKIFEPDETFTHIGIQRHGNGRWEVYLEEDEKGRILLANTGSGIKTVLLVLAFLYLIPDLEKKDLSKYLFGFEELENNLHPALQRRLLTYLRNVAVETGCKMFLSTHSNVSIDLFSEDDEVQMLHVTHDRRQASVRAVTTYVENKGVLDDLDIRASDLLQANGVIWVEGPSDRIYFNTWVRLFSEGEFREGLHYQCVFYGGRLLAHLSADDPDVDVEEALKILRVNRNTVVLIDSDRNKDRQKLNDTKKRIVDETRHIGGMSWVTKGREIENYIPAQAIGAYLKKSAPKQVGQFTDFARYLNGVKPGEGSRLKAGKPLFADRVCQYITKNDAESVLDLKERMDEVLERIQNWNK